LTCDELRELENRRKQSLGLLMQELPKHMVDEVLCIDSVKESKYQEIG
jgi:hypothetical protein